MGGNAVGQDDHLVAAVHHILVVGDIQDARPIGSGVAVIFQPLGFGHWQAAVATLTGLIAHGHGRGAARRGWNLAGAAVGSVAYVVLYLGKSLIMGKYVFSLAAGSPMMLYIVPKVATSLVNAVIAVAVAVPLWELVRVSLARGGLFKTA